MAADEPGATIAVAVVYSPAAGQVDEFELNLPPGSTAGEALQASGLARRYPGLERAPIGVWGRLCPADEVLRDRDRVEVYRALRVDPKEARRLRQRRQGGK
jgi:putative ubiquitin-RnfH superfamily antitoxin RatB of RatAB toxin-antitoxin module